MKKKNKILLITSLSILIIVSAIFLFSIVNREEKNIIDEDLSQEEVESVIPQEVIDDLKENVDKGHNGDVVDVKQEKDSDNNRTYTYVLSDGNTKTITIRKAKEGEEASSLVPDDFPLDIDDNNDEEKPDSQEKDDQASEDYGTVYEKFINMSGKEQTSFYRSFENPDDYYEWLEKAEAEYYRLHPDIVVDEGEVIEFN